MHCSLDKLKNDMEQSVATGPSVAAYNAPHAVHYYTIPGFVDNNKNTMVGLGWGLELCGSFFSYRMI